MSRPLSEWNKFVQKHASDPEIKALPARQRLAALSTLRQQMHASGLHTIVLSPKKTYKVGPRIVLPTSRRLKIHPKQNGQLKKVLSQLAEENLDFDHVSANPHLYPDF